MSNRKFSMVDYKTAYVRIIEEETLVELGKKEMDSKLKDALAVAEDALRETIENIEKEQEGANE